MHYAVSDIKLQQEAQCISTLHNELGWDKDMIQYDAALYVEISIRHFLVFLLLISCFIANSWQHRSTSSLQVMSRKTLALRHNPLYFLMQK